MPDELDGLVVKVGCPWDMGYQWDYKRGDWFLVSGCFLDVSWICSCVFLNGLL